MEFQPGGEFLTESQFCALVHINPKTAQRQRLNGDGPLFVRAGAKRILYRRADVEAWLKARTFRHRAEEAAAPQAA